MKFFRPRETPIENLTFLGISSALVALFSLASSFSVIASLALMLVLPLVSSLTAIICKWRYLPLYLLVSVLLSTLLSFASFQNEILFVLPSLLLGICYGMLEKSKCPRALLLFLCSILEVALFYLSIVCIKAFYEVDMVTFLLNMIGKGNSESAVKIFPTFALAYGFAQIAITHLVFMFTFSRFSLLEKQEFLRPFYWAIGLGLFIIGFVLNFFIESVGYFILGLSLYWTVFALISFFEKPLPIPAILLILSVLLTVLLGGLLYRKMPGISGMGLYCVILGFANLTSFLNDLLLRKQKKDKINP